MISDRYVAVCTKINNLLPDTPSNDIPDLFQNLPLTVLGQYYLDPIPFLDHLNAYLPPMPPDDIQIRWTGSAGLPLMVQSIEFIHRVVSTYNKNCAHPLNLADVMDFGAGWGRLYRLMLKYCPKSRLFPVDPLPEAVTFMNSQGITENVILTPLDPTLAKHFADRQFHCIYAFSVFTHLPPDLAERCLAWFHSKLSPDGLLAITVRQETYWALQQPQAYWTPLMEPAALADHHRKHGFAHVGFTHAQTWADKPSYGDTSLSIGYIEKNWRAWRIIESDVSPSDPEQHIVYLKPLFE